MIHGSYMWSVRKDEQEFRGITEMRSGWMIGGQTYSNNEQHTVW